MASGERQSKTFRQWNKLDSLDPSDVFQLYPTEKLSFKSGRSWRNHFSVYFVFIGFITLFLFGILVGFYVRESQKVSSTCGYDQQRKDGLDNEKLQSVHQNIMYYLSQKSIDHYRRKLEELHKAAVSTHFYDDPRSADFISQEFRKFGLDSVTIEEHSVVVTYPDSKNPNRLEFLSDNGTVTETITVERRNITDGKGADSSNVPDRFPPFAAFSPSGIAEGRLVYGNYGRYLDYLHLQHADISVGSTVVLLRQGKTSDPRKVQLAETFGAVGVLLFCHPDDCGEREPQFTSVADFSDEEPYYPTIPVQTVSQSTAAQLLGNISTTSLPASWLPSIKKLLKLAEERNEHNKSSNTSRNSLRVRLRVNTISSTVLVKNVIGIIHGGTESDRYVMVGTHRSSSSLPATTATTSTAVLLELARSFAYIRKTEGWVPRRGIKICSWGGGVLSDFGVYSHILNNKENIEGSAITSIDLDLHYDVSKLKVRSSPGLVNLVTNVAQMVPDPRNGEISIGDSWPKLRTENLMQDNSSLTSYGDIQSFPFLRMSGISSVQLTSRKGKSVQDSEQTLWSLLSHARVVSLLLSQLADHQYLPMAMERFAEFTQTIIGKSLDSLNQYCSKNLTDSLLEAVTQISQCTSDWKPVSQRNQQCQSELQVRKINNVLQKLDSHFVRKIPYHSTSYLLSYDRDITAMEVIASAIEEYQLTGNSDTLNSVVSLFISSLHNFSTALCQLKQILQNR